MMYQNFLQRYQTSLLLQDDRFIPAISVHSPYSTHPILAKKVLQIAREDKKVVATHFMESRAEREWLEGGKGEFKEFLRTFNPYAKPLIEPLEYLKLFYGVDTLFVHTTFANDKELEYINNHDYSIASCPVSNRVLENAKLDISKVKNLTIATDGLTSNISLNLWDELRASLFIHENIDIDELSKKLLTSVTKNSAKALKLNKGVLKNGYDADIIVVELPDDFEELESIYKWLILHTKEAKETIIQGENI
jgi:cytosine/adenosine deaminase-related metal-dependent hydrolase